MLNRRFLITTTFLPKTKLGKTQANLYGLCIANLLIDLAITDIEYLKSRMPDGWVDMEYEI